MMSYKLILRKFWLQFNEYSLYRIILISSTHFIGSATVIKIYAKWVFNSFNFEHIKKKL